MQRISRNTLQRNFFQPHIYAHDPIHAPSNLNFPTNSLPTSQPLESQLVELPSHEMNWEGRPIHLFQNDGKEW